MTLPRRGPVTPEQRLKDNLRTQANGSAYGQTPNSRPVNTATIATRIVPASQAKFDRITVQWFTDDIVADTGQITAWSGAPFDSAGNSVTLNLAGDDGHVYLIGEGIYSATLTVQASDLSSAPSDQVVAASMQITDRPDPESFAVAIRGGDPELHDTSAHSTSTTFYSEGQGLLSQGITVFTDQTDAVSADCGRVWVTLMVQRIL